MTDGFSSPVAGGGGALIRPSMHSPNYVGAVSGWTINVDGSAEFNSLTLRGTFDGTDFIINSAGIFVYSGAPAAGNLTASIAAAPGTDAFGNGYLAGLCAYNPGVNVIEMNGGRLNFGTDVGDNPSVANGQSLIGDTAGTLELTSGVTASALDNATLSIVSGNKTITVPGSTGPKAQFKDDIGSSVMDVHMSGVAIREDLNGNALTWQTPVLAAGYTVVNAKYRHDPQDGAIWRGELSQNTGVGAAGAATIYTLPAGTAGVPSYRPADEVIVPCVWRSSTGTFKGGAYLAFESSGAVILSWGAATANGDRFATCVPVSLKNIP